jgi:hypothetical protein
MRRVTLARRPSSEGLQRSPRRTPPDLRHASGIRRYCTADYTFKILCGARPRARAILARYVVGTTSQASTRRSTPRRCPTHASTMPPIVRASTFSSRSVRHLAQDRCCRPPESKIELVVLGRGGHYALSAGDDPVLPELERQTRLGKAPDRAPRFHACTFTNCRAREHLKSGPAGR